MAWWPPEIAGDEAGRWVREFVRALFNFPDPRAAVGGSVEITEEPGPVQANEQQEGAPCP